jgi:hypothetical protein
MSRYYTRSDHDFRHFVAPGAPNWREPQVGALGALLAHWVGAADSDSPMALATAYRLLRSILNVAVVDGALAAAYRSDARRSDGRIR